jgi:hypothetical protein
MLGRERRIRHHFRSTLQTSLYTKSYRIIYSSFKTQQGNNITNFNTIYTPFPVENNTEYSIQNLQFHRARGKYK